MMQVGMIVGFFTARPVNHRLVRSGIKEKMGARTHLAMMVEQMRDGDVGERAADEPTARERRELRSPVERRGAR